MGSETAALKLPIIDFSNIESAGIAEWNSVKSQVREALEKYGCFEALFDNVPLDIRKQIFGAVEEIFDLPLETKMRNVSKELYRGYVGQYPQFPLYESMGIDDAKVLEKVESFSKTLWPQGNSRFSNTFQSFSTKVAKLDETIRRMILESFGLEKYMEEHMSSTNHLLRLVKYKGPNTTEKKPGVNAHTDSNMITILFQNEVQGLEIRTKTGEWINVKFSPGSFIAMIGDSLHAWLNGRLYSPYHRVMMTGDKTRYSIGLFSIPKAGNMIKAPEEMVDEEHPLLFKPFDHSEYLKFYASKAGQRAVFALKTYCGISG